MRYSIAWPPHSIYDPILATATVVPRRTICSVCGVCTLRTVCDREALEAYRIFAISCFLCSLSVQSDITSSKAELGRSDARLQTVGCASCIADD